MNATKLAHVIREAARQALEKHYLPPELIVAGALGQIANALDQHLITPPAQREGRSKMRYALGLFLVLLPPAAFVIAIISAVDRPMELFVILAVIGSIAFVCCACIHFGFKLMDRP